LKSADEIQFKEIVEQGGYYRINKDEFSEKVRIMVIHLYQEMRFIKKYLSKLRTLRNIGIDNFKSGLL